MSTDNANEPKAKAGKSSQQSELLPLVEELVALIPGTDVEISMLQRYGHERWKERMLTIREKAIELRGKIAS